MSQRVWMVGKSDVESYAVLGVYSSREAADAAARQAEANERTAAEDQVAFMAEWRRENGIERDYAFTVEDFMDEVSVSELVLDQPPTNVPPSPIHAGSA